MNISIVTVHTMGRDAFKPKHASSVSISGVIDTGVNSNTGYVISDDHIKIIIDIQKYVVYNRFVHRRVICSIRNNNWIRWQTEMSAFLFSFFVICLIRLNFQQNQLYKEEFQYMEKNTSFTEGKIMQPLLLFAVPVLLALFPQAMYGAVDLLIVGKFASSANVSAVSTGSQIMTTPYHNLPAYKMLFLCFHGPSADFPAATWSSLQPPPVSYRKTPVHCTVFSFHVQLHKPSYHFPHGQPACTGRSFFPDISDKVHKTYP